MKNNKKLEKAFILLDDGTIFFGKALGVKGSAFGELCFNTGMTGYQEIFTDPSYYGQLMVTTNAHIGNYGVSEIDIESNSPKIAGLICKNFNTSYSRPAANNSLQNLFIEHNIVAISDVDTRALVSHIRDNGAMNAVISTDINSVETLKLDLSKTPSMEGLELASKVSTKKPYFFGDPNSTIKIAALDLGIKLNILRNLANRGAYIKVFPYNSSINDLSSWNPDGYFISNGPGDPETVDGAPAAIRAIIEQGVPMFGICLGHQLMALALGGKTFKLPFGHHGANHPVRNLRTGSVEITSQNHNFCVDPASLSGIADITHTNLNDQTNEGMRVRDVRAFSVQYHPEAGPGPHDSRYLFNEFAQLMGQR